VEASSPFTFAIIGIVVGFLIGMMGYRLFSKGERQRAVLRQTLLEREHHIAELRKAMGGLSLDVRQRLANIRAETDLLEQELEEDATRWKLDKTPNNVLATDVPTPNTADIDEALAMPRDYADGKSGTLSEDFGLKESANEQETSAPQPPRY